MTIRTLLPTRRGTHDARAQEQMRSALLPVSNALHALAAADAASEFGEAAAHAEGVVEAARADARRLVEAARQQGRDAGERLRARELAVAKRETRELVLAAQGRAFDSLRTAAFDALEAQATSPAGEDLLRRIEQMVCARTAALEASHPEALGALGAMAETADWRAMLPTMALVDFEIERMADSIPTLWT